MPGANTAAMYARFNEAAAVKPRKTHEHQDAMSRRVSFNEAAAVKPRKTIRRHGIFEASSTGFNEAAAVKPRKTLSNC